MNRGIRPQDIAILLKIALSRGAGWRGIDLANELALSPAEISLALGRCRRSRLLDSSNRKVMRSALLEFLLHGLKYVFPAEPGPICRGMPTAHSAMPLSKQVVSDAHDQYVWPTDDGEVRGQAIVPLYPSAPLAARRDPELYEFLALIDALRAGRAREQTIAAQEIENRLNSIVSG